MIEKICDTIVAVATAKGKSGIGIVKVSGSLSFSIACSILKKKPKIRVAEYSSFFAENNILIDVGLSIFFRLPSSFTGEDVVEFHAHGSDIILSVLVKRVLELGARLAEPGEFSFRAFFNKKIDLLQAESINCLINSKSFYLNKAILKSLVGSFSKEIRYVLNDLIECRKHVESGLDFSEDVYFSFENLLNSFLIFKENFFILFNKVCKNYFIYDKFKIVVIGKPNVGKSSLFNSLLKEDRSIISNVPGTTRDFICSYFELNDCYYNLVDTAGLNYKTKDKIEKEGIVKALKQASCAKIIVFVCDVSECVDLYNDKFFKEIRSVCNDEVKFLIVKNKIDRIGLLDKVIEYKGYIEIYMSVKTGQGFDLLINELIRFFDVGNENLYMINKRHYDLLVKINKYLLICEKNINSNFKLELIAEDVRIIHNCFVKILGGHVSNDLLSKIFSDFCIGK